MYNNVYLICYEDLALRKNEYLRKKINNEFLSDKINSGLVRAVVDHPEVRAHP